MREIFYLYVIICSATKKRYIGWTSKTISHRLTRHKIDCRDLKKQNKLYRAMRKYGEDSFSIHPLVICGSEEYVKELEVKLIGRWRTHTLGYNSTVGGDGVSGYRYTPTQRKLRSDRAKLQSEQMLKARLAKAKRPVRITQETRDKISRSLKGNVPWNKGLRGIVTSPFKGRSFEEIMGPERAALKRERMSAGRKGITAWNKGKKGLYHPSPEVMEKTHSKTRGRPNPAKAVEMRSRWANPAFRQMMLKRRKEGRAAK